MTLEFNTPLGHVKEWVMTYLMNKLMEFHHRNKEITRAEVHLREQPEGQKACAIELVILGDSLLVNSLAGSFEEACLRAVTSIEMRIHEKWENEHPTRRTVEGKLICKTIPGISFSRIGH
jgi:hypothetical protein